MPSRPVPFTRKPILAEAPYPYYDQQCHQRKVRGYNRFVNKLNEIKKIFAGLDKNTLQLIFYDLISISRTLIKKCIILYNNNNIHRYPHQLARKSTINDTQVPQCIFQEVYWGQWSRQLATLLQMLKKRYQSLSSNKKQQGCSF